jgi:molybdate transport system permease protein
MDQAGAIWSAVSLTLFLAALVTLLLVVIGTPIAWWLARSKWRWKEAVAAIVSLPLVLPPTVLGFYLLIALGPNGPGGALAGLWGARTLAFSFPGLVIGSVIFSLPFMVQPLRNAFEAVPQAYLEAAASLGARRLQTFAWLELPLARAGYFTGGVLTFAHTIGEFGVVLMIGGNIPGQTKVLSIAIYDYVERLEWGTAHVLSLGMVVFAFVTITATMLVDRRMGRVVR